MINPSIEAQAELSAIMQDTPACVAIPGTNRSVKIRGIKPYTIERLTRLWVERDTTRPRDAASTLKLLAKDPYFNHKQAALLVLNGYFKIRFFWSFLWRWWAYIRGYNESQLTEIIVEGKKKIPLLSYWTNLVYTLDMRNDWMQMTIKEAEQYRAELLLGAEQLSSKTSPSTEV